MDSLKCTSCNWQGSLHDVNGLTLSEVKKLDQEFKMFMRWRGVNIDSQLFDLKFEEPQNFAQYRQADIDGAKIGTFTQLEQYPYFSKRFLMKRYLGLSEVVALIKSAQSFVQTIVFVFQMEFLVVGVTLLAYGLGIMELIR